MKMDKSVKIMSSSDNVSMMSREDFAENCRSLCQRFSGKYFGQKRLFQDIYLVGYPGEASIREREKDPGLHCQWSCCHSLHSKPFKSRFFSFSTFMLPRSGI